MTQTPTLNAPQSWDEYFLELAKLVASRSKCLSRKVGAVLVRDRMIISTGYNGPPRGAFHCPRPTCPRRRNGYRSGEGIELCPAVHAEANAIVQAAANGTSTSETILYVAGNDVGPCKSCAGILINAGVSEIVSESSREYDPISKRLLLEAGVVLRLPQLAPQSIGLGAK